MRVRTLTKKSDGTAATLIAAAKFKTKCLEILDHVRETGQEYVVTKHGTPVARLTPCRSAKGREPFFGSMKGTVLRYDNPFDPIDGEYEIDK